MSNDENSNETVSESEETVRPTVEVSETVEDSGNALTKIMALKESNPKLFFGGIGGLVVAILAMTMMTEGSSNKHLPTSKMANLSIGQSYSLRGINTYDPMATVRLVAVPCSVAAYDDNEDDGGPSGCKHIAQGTRVKLLQIQEMAGMGKSAEIEIATGDCAGRKGWTTVTNLK